MPPKLFKFYLFISISTTEKGPNLRSFIVNKIVAIYMFLLCKITGPKIRSCKFFWQISSLIVSHLFLEIVCSHFTLSSHHKKSQCNFPKNAFFMSLAPLLYIYSTILWQSGSKQWGKIGDSSSWMKITFFLCKICFRTRMFINHNLR